MLFLLMSCESGVTPGALDTGIPDTGSVGETGDSGAVPACPVLLVAPVGTEPADLSDGALVEFVFEHGSAVTTTAASYALQVREGNDAFQIVEAEGALTATPDDPIYFGTATVTTTSAWTAEFDCFGWWVDGVGGSVVRGQARGGQVEDDYLYSAQSAFVRFVEAGEPPVERAVYSESSAFEVHNDATGQVRYHFGTIDIEGEGRVFLDFHRGEQGGTPVAGGTIEGDRVVTFTADPEAGNPACYDWASDLGDVGRFCVDVE